jgi:DNA processing protein
VSKTHQNELALLLACCQAARDAKVPWWQVTRAVERAGSAAALVHGPWEAHDGWEVAVARALSLHYSRQSAVELETRIDSWQQAGIEFVSINDAAYPVSLRVTFNAPPFITLRGGIGPPDARGVAVVGTRNPSDEGLRRASRLGRELAEDGVTVVSGLALGIDSAAHEAAIGAGGRTLAVLGHGLAMPVYPKANRDLAEIIVTQGALISQFLPPTPPTRSTFPMRNMVTSGIAQGTVVVEAGQTSGARHQAGLAVRHGKRVWLLESLVANFDWAREFSAQPGVKVISSVSEVISDLREPAVVIEEAERGLPSIPPEERMPRRETDDLALFR